MISSISHVALRAEDVASAESYYLSLFDLKVAFRDLTLEGVQQSLRPGVTWEAAAKRGIRPGLTLLWRDNFNLALEQSPAGLGGQLDHIGLQVEQSDIVAVAARATELGCSIVQQRADLLVFHDRYGVRWELTSTSYASPADQSTGARLGAWLDLG